MNLAPLTEAIHKTIDLVLQSERPVPAHFCSNNVTGLNGSFMINFDGLTEADDEEMSHQVYYRMIHSVKYDSAPDPSLYYSALRMGENLMAGMFILTLLGEPEYHQILYKAFREEMEDRLREHGISDSTWLDSTEVMNYFSDCVTYGESRARLRAEKVVTAGMGEGR